MWIPIPKGEFKSSEERVVTARAPEALDLYNEIIESKKKSRIMMHADELKRKTIEGGVKVANLIDFRLGFQNTLANIVSSGEMDPEDFRHGFGLR